MAPNVRTLGRHVILWMIGVAACVQTSVQSIVDFLDGRTGPASLWILGTVVIATTTITAERIKVFLEA